MKEFFKKNGVKVALILICISVILLLCFLAVSIKNEKAKDAVTDEAFRANDNINKIEVYVEGEVKNKGLYVLKDGANVGDAIEAAGGFTENANKNINLSFVLKNGSKVRVADKTQNANSGIDFKVNINTADIDEFMLLEGIGEKTAENIISYRENNGRFRSVDDIMRVKGIGAKLYGKIKESLVIE